MAAPEGVPIPRLQITASRPPVPPPVRSAAAEATTVAPAVPPQATPVADPNAAAPQTLYLATTVGAFQVTLPTDGWAKPGSTYEVVFAKPLETSCVALV